MKSSTLLPFLSLLSSTTASPSSRRQAAPHSHDLSHIPIASISGPIFFSSASSKKLALTSSSTSTQQQSTQAGARLSGSNITTISTIFRIPTAEMTTTGPTAGNENGVYQASYWVGIDGLSDCGRDIALRAGIDTFWDTGAQTAGAWWEWYPSAGQAGFEGLSTLVQGDVVRLSVTADSDGLGGSVSVEKMDGTGCEAKPIPGEGNSGTKRFGAGEIAGNGLCLRGAAVVIEDYPIVSRPDVPLPLANFTEVVFEQVKVGGGKARGLEVFDIVLEEQGGRLTDCEAGEGRVDCKRVVGDA